MAGRLSDRFIQVDLVRHYSVPESRVASVLNRLRLMVEHLDDTDRQRIGAWDVEHVAISLRAHLERASRSMTRK